VQTSVSFGQILSLSFPLVHNLSLAKQNLSLAKQNLSLAKHNLSLAKHNLSLECHNLSLHELKLKFRVFQTTGDGARFALVLKVVVVTGRGVGRGSLNKGVYTSVSEKGQVRS
jgi:hypothetical protein